MLHYANGARTTALTATSGIGQSWQRPWNRRCSSCGRNRWLRSLLPKGTGHEPSVCAAAAAKAEVLANTAGQATGLAATALERRCSVTTRTYTPNEDQTILDGRAAGLSWGAIGSKIGTTGKACQYRLTHGLQVPDPKVVQVGRSKPEL